MARLTEYFAGGASSPHGVITMRMKDMFLDRPVITRAVGAARIKVLKHAGGFARTTARRSIRRRKGVSLPGKPPYSHVGLLRDRLFFGYDTVTQSVVVGPEKLAKFGAVPYMLEYGGTTIAKRNIRFPNKMGTIRKSRSKKRSVRRAAKTHIIKQGTVMTIKPRPYMGPAFDATLEKFPQMWRDSIRMAA